MLHYKSCMTKILSDLHKAKSHCITTELFFYLTTKAFFFYIFADSHFYLWVNSVTVVIKALKSQEILMQL
jgi:hypothetical protein